MQRFPEVSSEPMPTSKSGSLRPAQASNIVYQGVTIAAMLVLLCTMWVF
jgi:hypothetical protein